MKKIFLLGFFSIIISASLIFAQTKTETRTSELTPYIGTNQNQYTGSDAIWDIQNIVDVGGQSGANGNAGVEFDGTYYYSARWGSNLLHKYDINGNLVEQFSIPGVTGLRDLAYDGTYFYGGAASTTIYQMDFTTKTLVGTITSPVAVRFIAYDSGSDAFWCGNWSSTPTLVSRAGANLGTITTGLLGQYGAAYDGVSAGGPYLWLFDQGTGVCPGASVMHQFNITTGTATGVTYDACAELD